jgi:hypothetical protein
MRVVASSFLSFSIQLYSKRRVYFIEYEHVYINNVAYILLLCMQSAELTHVLPSSEVT